MPNIQVRATGAQGQALHKLVDLVASSSVFQARRGVETTQDAEKHIYWPWLEVALVDESRPCAIIEQQPASWAVVAGGDQDYLRPAGSLVLTLTDNENWQTDYRSSATDFLNFADGVIADIVELAGSDDRISIRSIAQTQLPMQNHPTEEPTRRRYWSTKYEIQWPSQGP